MNSTDVYRLALPPGCRVLVLAVLIGLSLAGVGMLVMTLANGARSVHLPLILFWCAALAWNWYVLSGIPYEIRDSLRSARSPFVCRTARDDVAASSDASFPEALS